MTKQTPNNNQALVPFLVRVSIVFVISLVALYFLIAALLYLSSPFPENKNTEACQSFQGTYDENTRLCHIPSVRTPLDLRYLQNANSNDREVATVRSDNSAFFTSACVQLDGEVVLSGGRAFCLHNETHHNHIFVNRQGEVFLP